MINSDNYAVIYKFDTYKKFAIALSENSLDPIADCTLIIIEDTGRKLLYYLGDFREYYINVCYSLEKIDRPVLGCFYYPRNLKKIFYFDGYEFHETCSKLDTTEDPCICPKGDDGTSGTSGISGLIGPTGPIGIPGVTGPAGMSGTSGTSGIGSTVIQEVCKNYLYWGKTWVGIIGTAGTAGTASTANNDDPTQTGTNSTSIPHPPTATICDIIEDETSTHVRINYTDITYGDDKSFFVNNIIGKSGATLKLDDLNGNIYIYTAISATDEIIYTDIIVNTISETGVIPKNTIISLCITITSESVSLSSKTFAFFIS